MNRTPPSLRVCIKEHLSFRLEHVVGLQDFWDMVHNLAIGESVNSRLENDISSSQRINAI
ncbi:hypothetical protein PISMIDRAFT_674769 [Pisolithus microcarpus 441]|uniref:Uncharacterized protein n=1 Tax=Pisolithus microcarpus 441 TaxID=765257 RepID=A0A0C9ZNC0_9AGAM|nr:hypothetical protein PISMIDRAFT_674769 [Pisolithus microcarpus 441]